MNIWVTNGSKIDERRRFCNFKANADIVSPVLRHFTNILVFSCQTPFDTCTKFPAIPNILPFPVLVLFFLPVALIPDRFPLFLLSPYLFVGLNFKLFDPLCRFLLKLSREKQFHLTWSPQTPLKMSRLRSRTKKVSLLISRDSSLPVSSLKMGEHLATITFRRRAPFTWS